MRLRRSLELKYSSSREARINFGASCVTAVLDSCATPQTVGSPAGRCSSGSWAPIAAGCILLLAGHSPGAWRELGETQARLSDRNRIRREKFGCGRCRSGIGLP